MIPFPQPASPSPRGVVPRAEEALVLRHRRLASSLARRFARVGSEGYEDLEQVAYLGLVKAARRFEPERGVAFSTYAVPTILGELRRFCRQTRWSAHVPRAVQERFLAARDAERAYVSEHARVPTAEQLAELLSCTPEELVEARLAEQSLSPLSLSASGDDPNGSVAAPTEQLGVEDPGYRHVELREDLARALDHVSSPAQEALRLRVEEDMTFSEVAAQLGVSPSQASKLVERATETLRSLLGRDRPPRNVFYAS